CSLLSPPRSTLFPSRRSSDLYHPDKLQRQVELLDADPELGFVYCDIVTTDEAGQPLPEQPSVNSPTRQMSGNIFQTLMLAGYFPDRKSTRLNSSHGSISYAVF